MPTFEILCATMRQNDFSKLEQMNIRSNVVFANQADRTDYRETQFDGKTAKMITTQTRGVGINRNFALAYATGDICLFADDDVVYNDDMEEVVLREFAARPDADVIVFHLTTDSEKRKQRAYPKTRKVSRYFDRRPWATFRVAFRLTSARKANLWFTPMFGGGAPFPSGEDSLWITSAFRAGLTFYVSKETIGRVSFDESTWFTGYDDKFYYGKGAFYRAAHPRLIYLWTLYFALRTRRFSRHTMRERLRLMRAGAKGYEQNLRYEDYAKRETKNERGRQEN